MLLQQLRQWAGRLTAEIAALDLAGRDARTPWSAKAAALAVVAYALSPIDLIPDIVPVLGLLDDLLIVPFGIMLAVRLVPADLMGEFRAAATSGRLPWSRAGAVAVLVTWLGRCRLCRVLAALAAVIVSDSLRTRRLWPCQRR